MKICIAQTQALKGQVQENIQNHLQLIESLGQWKVDLVIFPELSITGYEPDLAKTLAITAEDDIFNPFQQLSDKNQICIGIGMPINAPDGTNISMLLFQPKQKRLAYAKQILHTDELPYFTPGNQSVFLNIKNKKIALGICYETLQRAHFLKAKANHADIYIASVAKSQAGIEKANAYFPKIAKEFSTPILMSNSVGFCDDFLSAGQSAAWHKNGDLIGELDDKNQGFLLYDTELDTAEIHQESIEKSELSDLAELFQIYLNGKSELERKGIFQWTIHYPTSENIADDLKNGFLYTLKKGKIIVGAISINQIQDEAYQSIDWQFEDTKVLVIHRLVVNPRYQRQGFAKKLMDFAEHFAKENNYTSIRLDVYSQNKGAVQFYKNRQYEIRGDVNFPYRALPFHCMEKRI